MSRPFIPFNKLFYTGQETEALNLAMLSGKLAGDGQFTEQCSAWLKAHTQSHSALLTHSCTAALEMAAMLLDLKVGDEVIMPSYTFVSTANAVALRGAVPVFIDIRPDTLNIDETLIESAITKKTKAIWPVHYAGVASEMDTILAIAKKHNLKVVEDAAQAICATYKGKQLGGIGDLGAFSFHETKNVIAGEGGSLQVNALTYVNAAEIIREKGTDRSQFLRGEIDKYSWRSVGSSYLPSELVAAFLSAQLKSAEDITAKRLTVWSRYYKALERLEVSGRIRRPIIPNYAGHNAHMFYVLLEPSIERQEVIGGMAKLGVQVTSHYVPLHNSDAGMAIGRSHGSLDTTEKLSQQIIRLPLWPDLSLEDQNYVVKSLYSLLS